MKELRVLGINVFFQNDKPGGIGLVQEFPEGDGGNVLWAEAEKMMSVYDANYKPGDVEFYIEQLKEWAGQDYASFDVGGHLLILCNVLWLETRGHIKSNDFNGVQKLTESTGEEFAAHLEYKTTN